MTPTGDQHGLSSARGRIIKGIPAPTFRHGRSDCTDTRLTWIIGHEGDRLWRCAECGRFKVEPITTEPTPNAASAAGTAPALLSRYVCRIHYTRVSWQGTGCKRCDTELAMTKAERRHRRRSEAEADRGL